MKVILLGPPGAGKGTQAARVAESLNIPRVSSGDFFRDHQKRDTQLGRLARTYMERGVLVPDSVTIDMVMDWVNGHEDSGGFLLDGFPRTLTQAKALDGELADSDGLDRAVNIKMSQVELVRRLGGRLICGSCQTPYHIDSSPPSQPGKCDRCGGTLYQRDDDKPDAVAKRIQVYFEATEPLVEYYREVGILREVEGERPVQNVTKAILEVLS